MNKAICTAILSFFNTRYKHKLSWLGNEPHKPDLAAALCQKIDPHLVAPGQTTDQGAPRVLWLDAGIPADILMAAQLYNTLKGKCCFHFPPPVL